LPRDELAGRVEPALEEVEPGRAVVVVTEIILAGPEEFHRNTGLLGDGSGFEHVVVRKAPTETAPGALHVHDDVAGRNVEDFGDLLAAGFRCLGRRPEFQLAVVKVGEAILRLHGGMRQEWIVIGRLHRFCGAFECGSGIAVFAEGQRGRLLREFLSAVEEAFAALLGRRSFVPSDA
jgi:hypothetical protein